MPSLGVRSPCLRPFVLSSFPGRTSARQSVCLATRLFFETALYPGLTHTVSSRFSLLRNALQKLKQIFSQDFDVTQKCTCPALVPEYMTR